MPLERAQDWFLRLVSAMRDGAVWYIPRAKTIYVARKNAKTLVRTGPGDEATEYVAKTLGWKIENKEKK